MILFDRFRPCMYPAFRDTTNMEVESNTLPWWEALSQDTTPLTVGPQMVESKIQKRVHYVA